MIYKERPYDPKKVASKIVDALTELKMATPAGICRKTGYDRRTVEKYLDLLDEFHVTTCKKIQLGQREITACSLTDRFKKDLKAEEHKE